MAQWDVRAGRLSPGVHHHARRFVRFGLVGASGVAVNMLLLYGLTEYAGLHYLAASVIATECAILNNFVLNNVWTFADTRPTSSWLARALRYNLFALGGLVITVAILAALTSGLGLHYLVANLFAIAAATVWNYGANYRWTWERPHAHRVRQRLEPADD
ncbi:MAG: GtrA family protein [Thermomicrobiaceae bacterium]|nr:GtrA family protein [Thermomicrobiaceae bacterium]